ncbi:MAG: ribosome-associated translation inhibitor RaiA [Alphaproteobacteria bacterium]|nr:ribosome-associated translation inhibitor RaiA [Alphaproteobacteria bacterium]
MELTVHGKQIDVGDSLRGHVAGKLEDLNQKYFNHATFATVTFSREGHGHLKTKAHISIQLGKNIMVVADGVENDPYVSFEIAATKVGKQLRRYKKKLRDHHERMEQTPESEISKARDYVLALEPEQDEKAAEQDDAQGNASGDPVVVAEMTTDIETMSVSEAVMRLDLSGESALLFRNASHGHLNLVRRRPDGNIGWIDPEGE